MKRHATVVPSLPEQRELRPDPQFRTQAKQGSEERYTAVHKSDRIPEVSFQCPYRSLSILITHGPWFSRESVT
jgi:hypothetical protein